MTVVVEKRESRPMFVFMVLNSVQLLEVEI